MTRRFRTGIYLSVILAGLTAAALGAPGARAGEPAYCEPSAFYSTEVRVDNRGLSRVHAFQLGKVKLVGLAVGESDAGSLRQLAEASAAESGEGYCTWYVNSGNRDAEAYFNFHPVSRPGSNAQKAVDEYVAKLGPAFGDGPQATFTSCAEKHGFVALGCEGMKHRGPTLFAMLLAYSGCTPEHSTEIVNTLWGLNGVPAATRLAVAKAGQDLAQAHPAQSAKLAELFQAVEAANP